MALIWKIGDKALYGRIVINILLASDTEVVIQNPNGGFVIVSPEELSPYSPDAEAQD